MCEPLVIETSRREEHGTFREIVERHQQAVYHLAYDLTGNHHDAEDLAQDVFLKAYGALPGFRGEASLRTWLGRIAVNTYLNQRRKKVSRLMRFFDDLAPEGFRAEEALPDRLAAGRVAGRDVERALDGLSPRERSAFVLRFYHDRSVREVAEALGVAEGTVKSLLFRATKKMQKTLAPYRNEPG